MRQNKDGTRKKLKQKAGISVFNPIMRWPCSLFVLLFFSGCCGWSSMGEGASELGEGQIAEYFKLGSWSLPEDLILRNIKEMVILANKNHPSRASVESIGMRCDTPPSRVCRYVGELRYHFLRGPRLDPDAEKLHFLRIEVTLPDFDDPNTLVVKKTDIVLDN